jgi:hypothetical protein
MRLELGLFYNYRDIQQCKMCKYQKRAAAHLTVLGNMTKVTCTAIKLTGKDSIIICHEIILPHLCKHFEPVIKKL